MDREGVDLEEKNNNERREHLEGAPAAEAAQAPKPRTEITVTDGGFAPTNANQLALIIEKISKGGGFPERFDSAEKRIAAYNLAHSLMGGRWQLALNNIAIIKGQMTIYGELPGAIAEQTREVEEKIVFALDKDKKQICTSNDNLSANAWAGVCKIKRKGREMKEFTYTIDEAIAAGQYPATKWDKKTQARVQNDDSPWMKFTKVMLMRKAMALAIKFEFPDALVGVPVAEYDFDEVPDLKDVTPSFTAGDRLERATDLNKRFTTPPQAQSQ